VTKRKAMNIRRGEKGGGKKSQMSYRMTGKRIPVELSGK